MSDEIHGPGNPAPVGWNGVMPFWIDTDGYTDRDREMFVAGAEFMQLYIEIKAAIAMAEPGEQLPTRCIMAENEDRVRMMAAKLGIKYSIEPTTVGKWLMFTMLAVR